MTMAETDRAVQPASVSELAAVLARESQAGRTVAIAGAGTKAAWGGVAAAADVTISTRSLDGVVAHRHGDLTATVMAGAPLAAVNRELARHGQWIALDPPFAGEATVGGVVATNDSGPRRHRFGAPRDQIIGIEIVRADGVVAKSGGIVVKNVAGYDLGRLMTGSFGSLAVIASATFKLYPLPPASRTVVVEFDDVNGAKGSAERLQRVVSALTASQLTPTALEVATHPVRVLVRFESIEAAADQQAAQAERLLVSAGPRTSVEFDDSSIWAEHARRPWVGAGAVVRLTMMPSEVGPTLGWLDTTLRDGDWEAVGRAGVGVLLLRIGGDVAQQSKTIASLRDRVPHGRGSVVVVRPSDDLKRAVDVWGPPGDALPLMRAVKAQFDPDGILNRGRGPFGI